MFITIDGPNAVGKSTTAARLAETLAEDGTPVHRTRQPSHGAVGKFAREHEQDLRGWPLAALVVADRYLQLHKEIGPALAAGSTVVCDRYIASTLVLQRIDQLDRTVLREMNAAALKPDLAVVLLAEPRLLHDRLARRGRLSRFEQMPNIAELEHRLYNEAVEDLQELGHPTLVIECTGLSVDQVATRIAAAV
jgi:dTMP kinase